MTKEQTSAPPPDVHIYTRSKQPWVTLPGDINRAATAKPAAVCEAYYNSPQLWPPESLARRKALFG